MSQVQDLGFLNLLVSEPRRFAGLFSQHVLMDTQSPQKAKHSVERVFFSHHLKSRVGRVNFSHRGARLSSLSFNLIRYGAEVEVDTPDVNRSHFVMVIPLSGEATVRNHDQVSHVERGHFIIVDAMTSFHGDMCADHSHLAIGIPRERLWTHAHRMLPKPLARRVEFRHSPYVIDDTCTGLFSLINYICTELERPHGLTRHGAVAAAMEEAFLNAFLITLLDEELNTPAELGVDHFMPFYLRRAEEFILANLTEEIDFQDVVKAVGVPARTLQHAFQKYHATGPMAWLRLQRLYQARLDLLQGGEPDLSVTDVALRYQMFHVGRFAAAYKKMFGELPSETLAKARLK